MKIIFLTFAVVSTLIINAQGLNFSTKEQISKIDKYDFEAHGFATILPNSYSLQKYVPPILQQEGGTCLGFASLYYGLSIMYNKKFNINSNIEKYAHSFDPYFIYTLINKSSNCEDGLNYEEAFELQSKIGAKKMFYPSFIECDSNIDKGQLNRVTKYTAPYKITNYYSTDPENINFITNIKKAIYGGYPVMVGVELKKSFEPYNLKNNPNGVKSDGLWNPKQNEKPDVGHAMCVIGYDNIKFGGCFKLANSWSTKYGDKGYVYIKYADFKKSVKEAYIFEIDEYDNQTMSYPNYKRFNFSEPRYKNHFYEGEVNENYINGFGIYSIDHKYFLIGEFKNGVKNGPFISINQDDENLITIYEFENDEIVKKISGFANNSQNKDIVDFTKYIKKISPNQKIIVSDEAPDIDFSPKK
jgi:C1A family cysteine protease